MRMHPYRGIDVGIDLCDRHRLPRGLQIRADVDHPADARRASAGEHLGSVAFELGEVEMGVRIEEHKMNSTMRPSRPLDMRNSNLLVCLSPHISGLGELS